MPNKACRRRRVSYSYRCSFAGKIRSSTREETRNAQLNLFNAMERQAGRESSLSSSCQEAGGSTTVELPVGGGDGGETDHRHDQPNINSSSNNSNDNVIAHIDDGNDDGFENSICFSLSNACAGLFRKSALS